VQVARGSARLSLVRLAAEADALPVGDTGRHLHLERALRRPAPPTTTLAARLLGHAALSVTHIADHLAHHLPERRSLARLKLSSAAAALAVLDRRSRLGSVSVAVLAAVDRLVGNLQLGSMRRFDQVHLDGHRHIAAWRRTRASPESATAAEERVEQVSDRAEGVEIGRVASGAESFMAIAVIRR